MHWDFWTFLENHNFLSRLRREGRSPAEKGGHFGWTVAFSCMERPRIMPNGWVAAQTIEIRFLVPRCHRWIVWKNQRVKRLNRLRHLLRVSWKLVSWSRFNHGCVPMLKPAVLLVIYHLHMFESWHSFERWIIVPLHDETSIKEQQNQYHLHSPDPIQLLVHDQAAEVRVVPQKAAEVDC